MKPDADASATPPVESKRAPPAGAKPAGATPTGATPTGAAPTGAAPTGNTAPGSGTFKPTLASEALREDLAPVEPWREAARWWCVVLGTLLALTGAGAAMLLVDEGVMGWLPHVLIGAVAIALGLAPLAYALRATVMMMLAVICGVLGISGHGPMGGLSQTVAEWSMLHLLAVTSLPAALLFRERYRAYPGARYMLAIALGLSVPFVAYGAWLVATADLAVQISAAVSLVAVAVTLLGFMGSNTAISGRYLSLLLIGAITAQLGTEALQRDWIPHFDLGLWWVLSALIAFAACAVMGALGSFQLLARSHWERAAQVNVQRAKTQRPPQPSVGDTWSTGG
jgi:hypothetical protein